MMTHYIVHIYRQMRLSYTGIEADTPREAAFMARRKPTDAADNVEDCDGETFSALVEPAGNDDHRQSVTIAFDIDIDALLAQRGEIAVPWSIADVKDVRPDLSDEQCWEVLENVKRKHDAEYGISWTTLASWADLLFGRAPETDVAGEA